jgi:hypothetical protein
MEICNCGNEVEKLIVELCPRCYKRASKQRERNKPGAKEHRRALDRVWCAVRKEELASYRQQRTQNLKMKAFALLGSKCSWAGCTWDDPRALQIDHVNDDGSEEKRTLGNNQPSLYIRVIKATSQHEEPQLKYQLLCANHNWVKRCEKESARRKIA